MENPNLRGPSSIDLNLFIPLSNFFQTTWPEPADLESFISPKLMEDHASTFKSLRRCYGLVFEAYMQWVLKRFSEKQPDFFPRFSEPGQYLCTLKYPSTFFQLEPDTLIAEASRRGNVVFRRNIKSGKIITELDSLYEFKDGDHISPIIFESKKGQIPKSKIWMKNRNLIERVYGQLPYICFVKPSHTPLPVRSNGKKKQIISYPYRKEFDELASKFALRAQG